jgi:uncharacterized protein GlcG (DUF336 family)
MRLQDAQALCAAIIEQARTGGYKPVAAAVLDERGSVRAVLVDDGCSIKRAEVAMAKANAVLAMGETTRDLSSKPPHFLAAISHIVGGMVPTAGGVFLRDQTNALIGAVGVSGESSDNDELIAQKAIEAWSDGH